MPKSSVPELQDKVFKSLGIEGALPGGKNGCRNASSRKEQRKADRVQKRTNIYSKNARGGPQPRSVKSLVKRPTKQPPKLARPDPKEEAEDEGDGDMDDMSVDELEGLEDEDDDDDQSEGETAGQAAKMSRKDRDRLARDDAEIRAFEKKLGIKSGRKGLPKSFKDDGLDELMGDLGQDGHSDRPNDDTEDGKRKSEYDEWLAAKRSKTTSQSNSWGRTVRAEDLADDDDDEDINDDGSGDDDLEDLSNDEADSFGGFNSDGSEDDHEKEGGKPRVRENPYVAPSTGVVAAKYVPPSLRKAAGAESDSQARVRKQCQGLINRLSDANILSIVKGIEELYQNNARGDVTEALTDIILAQVCKPEALPDQFFVLNGGFSAAIYKVIGSSFGSHLVRRVVKDFGEAYEKASAVQEDESAIPKEPSNLLTFLSQLYVFEVVRCKIIFDYMERLLADMSELNVELLLRICRNGGRLLRRDDPQRLRTVASGLSKAVTATRDYDVSVRTKFMVETINDLKNKKTKGKGLDSAVVSENVGKMKKHLGELKSQSRRFEGATPMGIDLDDVLNIDTRGKWWLVGASVPQEGIKGKDRTGGFEDDHKPESSPRATIQLVDDEDMDFVLPDYPKKARSQGLTLSSQIAIFSALMTGTNSESGWRQINNLGLKKDDKREIARVLVQCVGSEAEYNPYYASVGCLACADGKLRFAFQARLWQIFRAMGESLFGEEADDNDSSDSLRFQDEQRIRKVAQFYASLIAQGSLSLAVLRPLTIPEMEALTRIFMEHLLAGLLRECKSKNAAKEDARVLKAFSGAREVPKLGTNVEWFLREKLRKSKRISSKELRKLDGVKVKAMAMLQTEE